MRKSGDMKRLAELKDELRMPKDRLMRVLSDLEAYDRGLARRLGTIIGKIEDLQRRMPG
jgi:hypothetical protein